MTLNTFACVKKSYRVIFRILCDCFCSIALSVEVCMNMFRSLLGVNKSSYTSNGFRFTMISVVSIDLLP